MPDRRRARVLLALLTLVALVVLSIDFSQGDRGPLAALQRGAWTVFAPVTEGVAAVVRPVGGFFGALGEAGDLRQRNTALSDELAELRGAQPAVQDLLRENAELRGLLAMRDRLSLETVGARVIGHPPGQVSFSVLIDAGADRGLAPGMAVVDEHGLVGKLTEVVARHALVQLVSSPEARYAVRVAPSGRTALLQGTGAGLPRMELRDPSTEVEPGAEVVTRAFQGSTIPDAVPVGTVTAAGQQPSPRFRSLRPAAALDDLSVVQVVVNAPAQPGDLPGGAGPPGRSRPDAG